MDQIRPPANLFEQAFAVVSICLPLSKSEIYILNGWIEFIYSFVPVICNGQLTIASQYNLQMIAN